MNSTIQQIKKMKPPSIACNQGAGGRTTAILESKIMQLGPARTIIEIIVIVVALLCLSIPAASMLGGSATSIQTDSSRMKGVIRIQQTGPYTVHEITTQSGTAVREFVSTAGVVFGVAWQGPYIPDLQQILGTYFNRFSEEAKSERNKHVGRRPLNIQRSDIVIQTGGHMGAFLGRIYIPALVPAGVNPDTIR